MELYQLKLNSNALGKVVAVLLPCLDSCYIERLQCFEG
jgi:hypothetical protein